MKQLPDYRVWGDYRYREAFDKCVAKRLEDNVLANDELEAQEFEDYIFDELL